jgi:hypothetical protein
VALEDNFTDTDGTLLQSHSSDSGHSWTKHSSSNADAQVETNRARGQGAAGGSVKSRYYASWVPASADYDVEGDFNLIGSPSSDDGAVCGRMDTSAETYYMARYGTFGFDWSLRKNVAGTQTTIGSAYSSDDPGAGSPVTVKLAMSGTTLQVTIAGTLRINQTDSAISSAGRAGLHWNPINSRNTVHIDAIRTAEAGGGSTVTATLSLDAAIQRQITVASTLNAAVQTTNTATAQVDAAIQAARTVSTNLDATVLQTRTALVNLDAALQQARSAVTNIDAAVRTNRTASTSLDGFIQAGFQVQALLDAAVQLTRSAAFSMDAGVQTTRNVGTALGAAIQVSSTLNAMLDAAVQLNRTANTTLDAAIRQMRTVSASLDANIVTAFALVTSLDAAIQTARTALAWLDAYIDDPAAVPPVGRNFTAPARSGFIVPARGGFTVH